MRIVVCSSRPMLGTAIARLLQADGHEVLGLVGSLTAAHGAVRDRHPDVVVADDWPAGFDELVADVPFKVVLLSDEAGAAPRRPHRRPTTLVSRSTSLAGVIDVIANLEGGTAARRAVAERRPLRIAVPESNDTRKLAMFLSCREREVLSQLVCGADTGTLAKRLSISPSTARDHVQRLLTKMNAHSRLELVSMAVRDGLVDPTTGLWLVS
jgi:two-component system, NarL family, nitrate/nitrite response regulator NarL